MHERIELPADQMPELMDKASWEAKVKFEVAFAENSGDPLSVMFIDINAFKLINDELGHNVGDEVINDVGHLATYVAYQLRTSPGSRKPRNGRSMEDIVGYSGPSEARAGRIGGDEFGIIALNTDETGVENLKKRLRVSFEAYMQLPAQSKLHELGMGLAIGSATYRDGMTASQLLGEADQAMYTDKKAQLPELTREQLELVQFVEKAIEEADWRKRDFIRHLMDGSR